MPFTNAHHGAEREPFDLRARIETELRTRIEEAVDFVCLEAMVKSREIRGAPAPSADNERDRDEFMARVREFLERLQSELIAGLTDEERRWLGPAMATPQPASVEAEIAVQVALARQLPDYWQRFDAIRLRESGASPSGGDEPGSLVDRLLDR